VCVCVYVCVCVFLRVLRMPSICEGYASALRILISTYVRVYTHVHVLACVRTQPRTKKNAIHGSLKYMLR